MADNEKVTIHEPFKTPANRKLGFYQMETIADELTFEYKPIFGRGVAIAIIQGIRREIEHGPRPTEKTMEKSPGRFELMFKNTGRLLRAIKPELRGDEWLVRAPTDRFSQDMPTEAFFAIMSRFWTIVDLGRVQASRAFKKAEAEAWAKSNTYRRKQKA